MKLRQIFKLVTAIGESVLAIPVVGGLMIILSLWSLLFVMLGLHIATVVLYSKDKKRSKANVLGIVTSVVGFIPIVGWIMHVITTIVLWVSFSREF